MPKNYGGIIFLTKSKKKRGAGESKRYIVRWSWQDLSEWWRRAASTRALAPFMKECAVSHPHRETRTMVLSALVPYHTAENHPNQPPYFHTTR